MTKMTVDEARASFIAKHNKELAAADPDDLVIHGKAALLILGALVSNFKHAFHENHFLTLDHYFTKLSVRLADYRKNPTLSVLDQNRPEMLPSLTPEILDLKVYIEALAVTHATHVLERDAAAMEKLRPELESLMSRRPEHIFGHR